MCAFAVLIFRLLLGRKKLKSQLLDISNPPQSLPIHSAFGKYKHKRGYHSLFSSKRNSKTALDLISVNLCGISRTTLMLQERFSDLVHALLPHHNNLKILFQQRLLLEGHGPAPLHSSLPIFSVLEKAASIQTETFLSLTWYCKCSTDPVMLGVLRSTAPH